jgi:general secretion pathway protein N
VSRGVSGISLRNTQINVPVALLCRGIPVLNPFSPTGRLTVRTSAVDVKASAISGSADVLIEEAQAARLGALGDYRVALEGTAEGATLNVSTLRGPLRISGSGDVTLSGQVRFKGQASVDASERERFAPALLFIGVPRADGSVPLEWPLSGAAGARRGSIMSAPRTKESANG